MRFEDFQDGNLGGYLRYRNRTLLAILNFYVPLMPPIKFGLNPHNHYGRMPFEEFQDGCHGHHLGCENRTYLIILNLHVSPMPSNKFQLARTYGSRADVVSRFSRWPLGYWKGFAILNLHVMYPNASHQVWPQSDLPFGSRRGLKIFKMATMGPSWILELNYLSNSEPLCCSDASHQVSSQSDLLFGRRCHLKTFKWPTWRPSWISEKNDSRQF